MKLIEACNETFSKDILKRIKSTYPESVSFIQIYDCLGMETEINIEYGRGIGEMPLSYYFPYILGQECDDFRGEIETNLENNYGEGGYFSCQIGEDVQCNERIIINLKTQADAIRIMQNIMYSSVNDIRIKKFISQIKFYGVHTEYTLFKYDKVVIYYNRPAREMVFNLVVASGVPSSQFINKLSAFYHIAGDDSGNYPVGVAFQPVGLISFTENMAANILKYMTGKDYIQEEENDPYPVLEAITSKSPVEFAEEMFKECKKHCTSF